MAVLKVVDRDGVEHEVESQTGLKVMEVLRELDYGVAAICGGMCQRRCPMRKICSPNCRTTKRARAFRARSTSLLRWMASRSPSRPTNEDLT